ncbi:hypothetical protein [Bacillus wiedmannii]|uniref:hypothetical protein n=1 Tax=Bacillus wiedmannii TaxID=1890302 RepID=UPI000BEFC633|nr:hypothetical protein [Bacillus wiedmannii]PEI67986.1 hypothetical protein CN905_27975 [Bacillus wiedmannii]PFZ59574.1 hypothetical protein COL76_22915 [Bacillus wiedmannii]PHB64260.1 hypothetical protein COE87_07520 [Bacillus wiedmannii]PHE04590.1 hypothetical protein COF56_12145 [Bacillus wiedmannii]PHG63699.1 hypothetical protein COI55_22130 [Bacillus wiedmannii]
MKNKKIYICIFIIFVVILACCKYYLVNKNVPSEYHIEYNLKGETIKYDDFEMKVNSSSVGDLIHDQYGEFVPITVDFNVKNISNEILSAGIFRESSLGIGNIKFQTDQGEFDKDKLKELNPNETINIKLVYLINIDTYNNRNKNEPLCLYVSSKLYNMELLEKTKLGIRYGKAIKL